MTTAIIRCPVGTLQIEEHASQLVRLRWQSEPHVFSPITNPVLQSACSALEKYFSGSITPFNLPLAPSGTKFQIRVWQELLKIPYGKSLSYSKIAETLKTAPRAIGRACAANPLPIFIPCHRVTSLGGLGGYSAGEGIKTKSHLLAMENFFVA